MVREQCMSQMASAQAKLALVRARQDALHSAAGALQQQAGPPGAGSSSRRGARQDQGSSVHDRRDQYH
jgi:hypothetical protein